MCGKCDDFLFCFGDLVVWFIFEMLFLFFEIFSFFKSFLV